VGTSVWYTFTTRFSRVWRKKCCTAPSLFHLEASVNQPIQVKISPWHPQPLSTSIHPFSSVKAWGMRGAQVRWLWPRWPRKGEEKRPRSQTISGVETPCKQPSSAVGLASQRLWGTPLARRREAERHHSSSASTARGRTRLRKGRPALGSRPLTRTIHMTATS
jgi:hypothetical protein